MGEYPDLASLNRKRLESYSAGLQRELAAIGDPEGKLMQADLVHRCRELAEGRA